MSFNTLDTIISSIAFVAEVMLHTDELLSTTPDLENPFSNFLAGVQHLASGRLPSYLIPYPTIGKTLLHVAEEVALHNPLWHAINTSQQFYYSYASFIHVKDKNNLYITLQIFLGYHPLPLDIYEIFIFPIPTH